MPIINDLDATKAAAEIVKAAVLNGTVKLIGSAGSLPAAENNAKLDAKYLGTLIQELTMALKQ